MHDDLKNPKRYTLNKVEYKDFGMDAQLCSHLFSAGKYIVRYKHKDGLKDLQKAEVFLGFACEDVNKIAAIYVGNSARNYRMVREDWNDLSDKQFELICLLKEANVAPLPNKVRDLVEKMLVIVKELQKEYLESEN